jgi:hypothetical protein
MLHEALSPYAPSLPFGFILFVSLSLEEARAKTAGISETSGE